MSARFPYAINLREFVRESNRIEGILREPTEAEIAATAAFLQADRIGVPDVEALVAVYAPGKWLRRLPGMNIQVGAHRPPPGGPDIEPQLADILADAEAWGDPWKIHVAYELLHPFMDGNGRSGRALWARQMARQGDACTLGFLHRFYYQTLHHQRNGGTA